MKDAAEIRIVGYDDAYADDFGRLNYEWIEKYFVIEEHDREMLDDPRGYVVEKGGEVFFALDPSGKVVGTVAMIKEPDGRYELAKMAVSPEFQGRGIANMLIKACIDLAAAANSPSIFLESNRKLGPALNLYRKSGFEEVPLDENSLYSRCDIRMELAIGRLDV